MAKKKEISLEKRSQIEILRKIGTSMGKIAQIVGVSKNGVQTTLKRFADLKSHCDLKRSGRPKKTSNVDDRNILRLSKQNRFKPPSEIRVEVNETLTEPISTDTVKRRLRDNGFFGRIALKKPLLKPQHRQKRLEFARKYRNWTMDQWKLVLWSDETKIEFFGTKRRQYVRRKEGERYKKQCIAPTVKFGGGSVMIWGCFSYAGVGDLVKIEGIMRKENYHQILQRSAIPSGVGLIGYGFTFQHDNDPKHTSKLCTNYLRLKEDEGVLQVLDWPAQSPDINPIELLWDELKRQAKKTIQTNEKAMFDHVKVVWNNIQIETLQKLVERMPRICEAVIKAGGGHFNEKTLL